MFQTHRGSCWRRRKAKDMRQCRTCGAGLDSGANFCGHCGAAITVTASALPPMLPARLAPDQQTRTAVAVRPARLAQPIQRAQPPVARRPVRAKSRFLAALLEWVFPGFGLMYAGSPWKGALVLFGTFIATGVALLYAIGSAPTMQFEDAVDFFVWLFLAHLVWLLIRVIWAWRIAGRNTRLAVLSVT